MLRVFVMKPVTYANLAAVLFAAQAIFTVAHRILGREYRGFTHGFNVMIDVVLAVVWTAAAVTALVRRPPRAGILMVFGAIASIMHGVMFSLTSADAGPRGAGIPFLLAGVVESIYIARSVPAFRASTGARAIPAGPAAEPPRRHFFPLRPRHSH